MNLLTLDLATSTGWAYGPPDRNSNPEFGTNVLPRTGNDVGRFLSAHESWMSDFLEEHPVDHVCYESPVFMPSGTQIATLRKLFSLAGLTELICHRRDLPVTEANNSSVKKYFAGTGRAKKPEMIAAAKARGLDVANDDEADALGIWLYTINRFDQRDGTNFAQKWDLVLGQVA